MAPRTNERPSTANSEDSLALYLNGGSPPKNDSGQRKRRRRACPVLSLLGLLLHFLSAGCGVALSVIVVRFGLRVTSAGVQDLVGRILFFVASCMGLFYVLMHACAARETYVRSHVGAQFFGFFSVAVAIIIMRLEAPVWIAAVVMSALVAAGKGFILEEGVQGNVIWIQLGIASLGLVSIFLIIIITERTDRPFATSIFSKRRFIMGIDRRVNRADTFDMSVSRQGFRKDEKKNATVVYKERTKDDARESLFDRSLIVTPTSWEHDDDEAVPTVPVMPTVPDWRQRRDAALRTTMRADDSRSQAVPSPLTAVYEPATPPDTQDSLKKYGSHFSWRPPTRDSTFSPRASHDMDDYRNNWPPTAMLDGSKSPNRASAPPPSEPPDVPLPPLVPSPEVVHMAETANVAETTTASQRSTFTDGTLPDIDPASSLDAQLSNTEDEKGASITSNEQPAEEIPRARGRRPALPSLEKLSARAAARHNRTSMLVRTADLKPRPSLDLPENDVAATLESSRSSSGVVEASQPEIESSDIEPEEELGDDSGFESEDDEEELEDTRPRHRSRSLIRSNTAGPRLVRNFSRPRVPSGLLRRRPSEGKPPTMLPRNGVRNSVSRRDSNSGSSFTAPTLSALTQQFRRSRSVPAIRGKGPTEDQDSVVQMAATVEPTVPILQAAPARKNGQTRAADQSTAAHENVFAPGPALSLFPSAATSMAPEKKVKGLGQGSSRRLEQRVTQWREGVNTQDATQAELDAERQTMREFDTSGQISFDDDSDNGGGRRSIERRGRSQARSGRGAHANKLSRERSMTIRARRAAQNF